MTISWAVIAQSVIGALLVALILGGAKLNHNFNNLAARIDLEELDKLTKEFVELKTKVEPVVAWYIRTSMDALKIATNPTSERLTELADKYIASITKGGKITNSEKQELIDGLMAVLNDRGAHAAKRQSASLSLRFIESQEGLKLAGTQH